MGSEGGVQLHAYAIPRLGHGARQRDQSLLRFPFRVEGTVACKLIRV